MLLVTSYTSYLSLFRRCANSYVAWCILLFVVTLFALTIGAIDIPIVLYPRLVLNGMIDGLVSIIPSFILDNLSVATAHDFPLYYQSDTMQHLQETWQKVVWDIRLPRIIGCMLVGMILALSGLMVQQIFRNPLAEPSIIGIPSGASFGVSCGVYFLGSLLTIQHKSIFWLSHFNHSTLLVASGMVGASAAMVLLFVLLRYTLPKSNINLQTPIILLIGLAITAFFGGLTSFVEILLPAELLKYVYIWRMGGLDHLEWVDLNLLLLTFALLLVVVVTFKKSVDVYALGAVQSKLFGIQVERFQWSFLLTSSFAVVVCMVSVGIIGFVGLMVPHLARILIGSRFHILYKIVPLIGAILVLMSDVLARSLVQGQIFPVGSITALFGAPFFVFILIQTLRNTS